jgi:lipoprotein NlpD
MKSIRQKRKEVGRKSLFSRFVYLYRLTVVNEDEQRRVFRMKISHFILTVIFLAVAGLGAWGGIAVFRRLPKQVGTARQDYLVRQAIVNEALRIDSLEQVFELQNKYITNLQDIIAGTVSIDTVYSIDSLARVRSELLMERSEREENFMRQYEEAERYNITSQSQPVNDVLSISIFRPTAGLVSQSYNALEHH